MSADNYLAIRRNNSPTKPWEVFDGNASTEFESRRSGHPSRDEAIDAAMKIMEEEMVEYGISYVDPITEVGRNI